VDLRFLQILRINSSIYKTYKIKFIFVLILNKQTSIFMKKLFFTLSVILISSLAIGQCADTANIHKFNFNGKKYEIVKELQNWSDAAACAVERGGYLIEINSAAEQSAVYNEITTNANISSTYVTINNGGGIAYVWIGATDQGTEGIWLWDGNDDGNGINFWNGEGSNGNNNGTVVGSNYVNWGGTNQGTANEPDNYGSGQNHAAIALAGWPAGTTILGEAGEWNDIIGSSQIYYVIEYDSIPNSIEGVEQNNIEIYPNPAIDEVNINNVDFEFNTAEIFDITGKLIISTELNSGNNIINIAKLESGIFIIKLSNEESTKVKKLIIE
jgi:hypothetical protein